MWKKSLLIIGLSVLMIGQVNSQDLHMGPQVGYYRVQDADEGSFLGGVALRLKLAKSFGVEASINYRQENYVNNALTVRSWPIMVTGLIYALPIVYGAIGFGWYNTTLDYNQNKFTYLKDETTQKVGWHFGGGVELPIGSNSKLSGDIRYMFLNYDFKEIPGSSAVNSNFYVITIGYLFGL